MRIKPEQLSRHLQGNNLLPVYLVCGDEPLQAMEVTDQIRLHARSAGAERTVMGVEKGFDWNQVLQEGANMGLFSSERLIELRMAHHSPGKPGSDVLVEYCESTAPGNTLLITMDKLEKRMQQGRWFKAIDKHGAVIQVWPVEFSRLPDWIAGRLRSRQKTIERGAAELIAQRTEGNLLATQQELEKLCLLVDKDKVTLEDVQECVMDSSRYDVFKLIEYALQGNGSRVINMLRGLRQEGVEAMGIYGAIMWELRRICAIAGRINAGVPSDAVFNEFRVWYQRQAAINQVIKRFDMERLNQLLSEAIQIDRALKGALGRNPWEMMENFLFHIGGIKLPS